MPCMLVWTALNGHILVVDCRCGCGGPSEQFWERLRAIDENSVTWYDFTYGFLRNGAICENTEHLKSPESKICLIRAWHWCEVFSNNSMRGGVFDHWFGAIFAPGPRTYADGKRSGRKGWWLDGAIVWKLDANIIDPSWSKYAPPWWIESTVKVYHSKRTYVLNQHAYEKTGATITHPSCVMHMQVYRHSFA